MDNLYGPLGQLCNPQVTMADFRAVHFAKPEAFLDALKAYDDSFMNFALGSLLDSMNPAYPHSHDRSTISRTLLAVYKGDQLLYVPHVV